MSPKSGENVRGIGVVPGISSTVSAPTSARAGAPGIRCRSGNFTKSVFVEVKAVAAALAKPPPAGKHPVVYVITTENTTVPRSTIDQGTISGLEIWQQQVLYD
jgi:hypothetical protein